MTAQLWVARHPKVVAEGICYGQSDMPSMLPPDEAGATILAELGSKGVVPDRIVTSPWSRTRGTARVLGACLGRPLVEDARISELHFGVWEGLAYSDLAKDAGWRAWAAAWTTEAAPGGESVSMLMARVKLWAIEIASGEGIVLAVTHAGVIRALRAISKQEALPAKEWEPIPHLALEHVDLARVETTT